MTGMTGQTLSGPAAPEPRVPITFLTRPSARDWLDTVAHHHHLRRSDVIRACMAVSKQHAAELDAALERIREHS